MNKNRMVGIVDAVLICVKCGQKIKIEHLKCQKEKRQALILEFQKSRERIIMKIGLRYGKTAKGLEYIKILFKEEFERLKKLQ